MTSLFKYGLLSTAICFTYVACASASPEAGLDKVSAQTVNKKASWVTVNGQNAQGYVKPGAPVSLRHNFNGKLDAGQIGEMNLEMFMPPADAEVSVSYRATDGLTIISGGETYSTDVRAQDFENAQSPFEAKTIRFQAAQDGRYYINAFIDVTYAGGFQQGRALSLPVNVGNAPFKSKSKNTVIQTSGGRSISVMPAQETIIQ